MKDFFFKHKINLLFLFISFACLVGVLGIKNISFQSIDWLYFGSSESPFNQLGWYFYSNDIWRFPLGSNPNYGYGFGNSIVFTDSIPILAIIFKLLKPVISEDFQYFSLWYLICFYFQLFFSFKILKTFTNSIPYSLIGSLFFLISPIFILRVNWHAAISGQWILLIVLYLALTHKVDKSKWLWFFLIIFTALINFYFMMITIVVYTFLRVFDFFFEKKNIYKLVIDFFLISILLLITLYVVGYFEVRMMDTLATGFGNFKLNLLSIFDPVHSAKGISWSWFLPDIKLSEGEEYEGFNYFGLGQIMMLLFALLLFLNKNYKTNLISIRSNKKIKIFILISVFLFFWSLSNKISFGSYTLVEIPLNKYIFGILSMTKSTGRVFWIVNYFLLTLSIIIIFNCFDRKKSLLAIILFFTIQVSDISAGLKDRIVFFNPINIETNLKDKIWIDLFQKYKIIKTTYPISWGVGMEQFAYFMDKYKIQKTNFVVLGRVNRKALAKTRYNQYDNFRKKALSANTFYVVSDLSHLRHLKYLFENENIGFFFRDNFWIMAENEKERMNEKDKKIFNGIESKLLEINEKKDLYFQDKNNYYGFGWSHNFKKLGIWSEGQTSTLFFKTEKNYGDLKLEIFCKPYITEKSLISEFDIYVNNIFNKSVKLEKNVQDAKLEILIDEKFIKNNEIKIDFNFKNLTSPYDTFESPDSRKLGILLKNIRINPV